MNAFVTRIIDPDLSIILLLIAPLSAALVSLFGKIASKKAAALLAFLLWFSGTVWALFSSIGPIFCGDTLRYTFGGWAEPYGIVLELNGTGWIAGFIILALGSAALLHTYTKDEYGPLFYSLIYLAFFSLEYGFYTNTVGRFLYKQYLRNSPTDLSPAGLSGSPLPL